MNLDQILLIVVSAVLFVLWLVEIVRRRNVEAYAASLQVRLEDAADWQVAAHERVAKLQNALDGAVRDRNAANLRAQRAINSLRALPEVDIHCKLPADKVHTTTFNLN